MGKRTENPVGRPKGVEAKRSEALAVALDKAGDNPALALVRIAKQAEMDGEDGLAIDAWKAVLPFVRPRPKPVEIDMDAVIAMAREIGGIRKGIVEQDAEFEARLDRAWRIAMGARPLGQ